MDLNRLAARIVKDSTDPGARDDEKDTDAVERGRKGGQKGGAERAKRLSPERRTEIARAAARARWGPSA